MEDTQDIWFWFGEGDLVLLERKDYHQGKFFDQPGYPDKQWCWARSKEEAQQTILQQLEAAEQDAQLVLDKARLKLKLYRDLWFSRRATGTP